MPDTFPLEDRHFVFAAKWGLTDRAQVERETERFLLHHGAKGSKMLSWEKAWQTWMTNALRWGGSPKAMTRKKGEFVY